MNGVGVNTFPTCGDSFLLPLLAVARCSFFVCVCVSVVFACRLPLRCNAHFAAGRRAHSTPAHGHKDNQCSRRLRAKDTGPNIGSLKIHKEQKIEIRRGKKCALYMRAATSPIRFHLPIPGRAPYICERGLFLRLATLPSTPICFPFKID